MMRLMQSKLRGLMVLATSLLTLQLAAAGEKPEKPAKPEKGKGWYVMMLWEAGTPIPGSDGTRYMKKVKEPDLAKLGGKLLRSNGNKRLIELPVAAAKELRRHESVSTLQRLWAGEPLEELKEEPYESSARPGFETEADTNLDWGPKDYTYDGSGNIKAIGPDSYSYDTAGRLIQSTVNGKTETFKYDAFGNLIEKAVAGANPEVMPVDGSSNRLIGASYDTAGNLTTQGVLPEYEYDSFNMLKKTPGGRYNIYDANDERIGVIDDDRSRWWIQDLEGRVIREFTSSNMEHDLNWFWQHDYVYAGGHLVGGEKVQWKYVDETLRETWFGGKRHYHLDHLGSVRVVTDNDGRSVSEHDYYAFGVSPTKAYQEEMDFGNPSIDSMRFVGHQRDNLGWLNIENTDYLDYMHARYYDPNLGRFLSVDPGRDWNPKKPQSWNMYSYVRNNPVNATDPTGMQTSETITVTAPDPGPSFSMNGFLSGSSNSHQLDRMWNRLTSIQNPVTGLTVGQHWRASGYGVLAFADGVVPFGDPFEDVYDDGSVDGLEYSRGAGVVTQEVAWAAAGGQVIRVTKIGAQGRVGASLFRKGDRAAGLRAGAFNRNSTLRFGWSWRGSRAAGQPIFRAVVGPNKAPLPWLRHMDFW